MPGLADRLLTPKEQKFIRECVKTGVLDIDRAAKYCKINITAAKAMAKRPAVKADINRRLQMVQVEQAKLDAKRDARINHLTEELVDKALADTMALDPKEHAAAKLSAIRTVLVLQNRIRTKDMEPIVAREADRSFVPVIYGQVANHGLAPGTSSTTVRRTEEVIETHASPNASEAPSSPPPKTIQAHTFEVLEH